MALLWFLCRYMRDCGPSGRKQLRNGNAALERQAGLRWDNENRWEGFHEFITEACENEKLET